MIKKINKIRNLDMLFSDYRWDTSLPSFERFNLIYGWNGSGKTTLSRLFDALEDGALEDLENLEYEIENEEDGGIAKYSHGQPFNRKVRVFNQRYIENNLKIRDGKAKAITLVLGEVNKEADEQIEEDEAKLKTKNEALKKTADDLKQKNKSKDKTFTEIAKTIYVAIMGGAIRNYRRDSAQADFKALVKEVTLTDGSLKNYSFAVKQSSRPNIEPMKKFVTLDQRGESIGLIQAEQELIVEAKALLSQTVESQIIDRLKGNAEISNWVETGLDIHRVHESAKCEFCNQILPESRLLELSKHFNDADKTLKQNIDKKLSQLSALRLLFAETQAPDKARFYDELQNDYESCCESFERRKTQLLKAIDVLAKIMSEKKLKTTETVKLTTGLDTADFITAFDQINEIIAIHNTKTSDFENQKAEAVSKLKQHYLSTIFDDVKALDQQIGDLEAMVNTLQTGDPTVAEDLGIDGLKNRIVENQAKISSTHKACEDINKALATFLGRDELVFEPHKAKIVDKNGQKIEVDDGYSIQRNGRLASNLSEGEKTAIAFVYFTVHLKDQDFDLNDGIVVIDDPVSSLDSNSLFQAFAFLKNAVREARQLFVLTHNFEFLRLLLNWIKPIPKREGMKSFYMLKNKSINNGRVALITEMDKELREYESEYHYLFKILKEFESDGSIAQAYPIPNMARKVLETFLMFRVPSGQSCYKKLEALRPQFDEVKLTAIYKFTNEQSHITGAGFDPALVPETQKNISHLLELMQTVFPDHYRILEESIAR